MHSVQERMWDPQPPSKHASPHPPPYTTNSRLAHVTRAAPAKRITFYKSGDNQFGGVRMAIHKRSFKCFDALLDDLSQKVPLPFGVRTVTTPRGTHSIKHLEQLQDGGCYLCSDRRQAKPINMDLATKRPSIWYYHSRRPQRPDASSATPPGYFSHRHRRILLVKNSEPSIRKSIVLSRRSTRSLRAFLEEVSEVMQFHVRKLYTVEGRKIDGVQSLMTCPGVLVCVGREAFSPVLVNFIRKSSEEKLPGLSSKSPGLGPRTPGNGARSPATQGTRSPPHGAQSRASEYSEGLESKKNVNFGLETKKSIIHPRSDSSNRSARFSLSSEKSYGNGISALSQAKTAIMNDDIEKRVLVNKDGSLSLEMRVRFHLQNDETLQWSTHIKKSPPLTNDCCPLSQDQPHYLQQGQSESCSDPDSASFDPEGVGFSSQPLQCALEGNHCPCCYQRQEQQYDLWENPAHSHKQPVPPPHGSRQTHTIMRHSHSSSSSSSCNSRRVVRCRAKLSNSGGVTGSEQSQLVQEEMCVTEQVEHRVEVEQDGDTHIEVCKVSRCCSRSEVITVDNTSRPQSGKSCEDEVIGEEEEGRPVSAVSNSSHVLQALKEDQDDEEDDLPPSASQCCQRNEPSPAPTSQSHVNDKPTSNVSAGSIHSPEHNKQDNKSESRAESACQGGAATPRSTAGADTMARASSAQSKTSRASHKSTKVDDEEEDVKRAVSGLSGRSGISAGTSVCPNCGGCKRQVPSNSNSRASQRSYRSNRLSPKPGFTLPNQGNTKEGSDNDGSDASDESTQSNKSNITNHGRISAISNEIEGRASSARSTPEPVGEEEERTPSAASAKSHRSSRSHKSGCKGTTCVTTENVDNRSQSAMSAQSNLSTKTKKSNYSATADTSDIKKREEADGENVLERVVSSLSAKSGASVKSHKSNKSAGVKEDETNGNASSVLSVKSNASAKEERPASALSAKSVKSTKSEVSAQSKTSHKSSCSNCARAASPGIEVAAETVEAKDEGPEAEDRTASAMSVKSNISAKSNKSHKSNRAAERTLSPRSDTRGDAEVRAASQMSAKSGKSIKSTKSSKPNCNGNNEENSEMGDDSEEAPIRAGSALSVQSNQTKKSLRVASPAKGKTEQNRTSSAMSGKSHTSAKSSKSQKTNQTPAAISNSTEADAPSVEANGNEEENNERGASAMSVTSKSSKKSTNPVSRGDEGNETTERPQSAVSAKSEKSNISSASNLNGTAESGEKEAEDNVPKSRNSNQTLSPRRARSPKSPGPSSNSQSQQLSPGTGETRGSSVLSVHSTASAKSAKSSRSKCHCGAGSGLDKVKKESMEEAESERAASVHSSSSKRQRRESGGTEQPLSRNSSGSVSLGLTADPETTESDSESCANADQSKSKTETPDVNKSTEEVINEEKQRTGSAISQTSNNNGNKSTLSKKPSALDIPTIKTPGGHEDEDEDEDVKEHTTNRAPSEASAKSTYSAKSTKSNKSLCKCSVKAASPVVTSKPVERDGSTRSIGKGSVKSVSSATSSAKARVRSKSPKKNATPSGESGNGECENQASSTPTNEAKEEVDLTDNNADSVRVKSPCCLRPESAASQKKEIPANSPSQCPVHISRPNSQVDTSSESILSHSLSAADLLKDRIAAGRPNSQQSKASKSKSEKSGKSQRSKKEKVQLIPSCLPNASPNEVVSDWLRSIPANSSMLALGDELNEEEKNSGEDAGKEEEKPEDKKDKEEAEDEEEKEKSDECDALEEESSEALPADATVTSVQPNTLQGDETLHRSWHSSAAVMKVLLGSSMGRCRSMPEVSPVYGRRLSTSAKGLLDCLSQLQLIEPAVSSGYDTHKNQQQQQQYNDIMAILQTLWLAEPRNVQTKDVGTDQVTPPRSSSGVGMSSGSGGSGKENENRGGEEKNSSHEDEEAGKVLEEGGTVADAVQNMEEAKTDTTEELQSSVPPSLDSPKATEIPSSSDKSSANDSSKSPSDNERETLEDSSSDTPPTVVRAPLTKRVSQDPDPVWVMHLLKKLEKQFMSHYTNAMAEFKVRWDLDDSLILNTMISELKDEVNRRIQASIQREMKKIQSRAGKGGRTPRPPQGANLSRESTTTEKRRRLLKVMKNQSVKTTDSFSDDDMTAEFSDQRSEDEYCPCDACVRKKMAARPLKKAEVEAPVMMEFDLLKILQLKKMPCTSALSLPTEEEGESTAMEEEEIRNLEVVQEEEEEEETKEDIKPEVVLEVTIPEEDEEKEEVQEEGEAAEENDEEEEEEEVECQCQCARNEEDSDKADEEESSSNTGDEEERGGEEEGANAEDEGDAGEDENGDDDGETGTGEEEESDKDAAKEAKGNEGETSENGEGDEDDDKEEEEKSEEETTKKESGEEEEEEEDAAKTAANEESTAVEGNVSASAEAEDEDDGDDDTTEGESHEEEKGGEASEEERASAQDLEAAPAACATEGEEGDAEDSDTDKLPSNTSADESGHEGGGTTGNEADKEGGGDGDDEEEAVEDAVEEFKPDKNKKGNGALLHQFTKTSVESQPGSLEDVDADSPPNPVDTIEVPKMASTGGAGQRRSRSPGRVQRRKPKESDVELDHSDM